MSFRPLVEGDCGGANPLVQFGQRLTRDSAYKEEGFSRNHAVQPFGSDGHSEKEQMIKEFLGQISGPPNTFQMDNLLEEMREIEQQNFHPAIVHGPKVFEEVQAAASAGANWANNFGQRSSPIRNVENMDVSQLNQIDHNLPSSSNLMTNSMPVNSMHPMGYGPRMWNSQNFINVNPVQDNIIYAKEFFDDNVQPRTTEIQEQINNFFGEEYKSEINVNSDEWLEDFQKNKAEEAEKSESYYDKFWSKLQQDWNDLSESESNSWLTPSDYDFYQVYSFAENNPMINAENVLEKGKEFLKNGDIPSAVLCFEAAVKQSEVNFEAWELLGYTQAENEMDSNAIAALKKAQELQPNNMKVLMALAISYTNESMQSQALTVLAKWLYANPAYKHLVPEKLVDDIKSVTTTSGSLMAHGALKQIQSLFLEAVQMNTNKIDPQIQEALGVLFNLSSEFDKAVDCFRSALAVDQGNAKLWNRLGASLANGNRSIEAVEAYKQALLLEPGFIRARYNVGIICMNLKSYTESSEHLLTALNMQATSPSRSGLAESNISSQMSDVIWSTLRMVFALQGRDDLKKAAIKKDLDFLNKELNL